MTPARVLHFRNCRGISTLTGPETYLLDLFAKMDPWAVELHLVCLFNPRQPEPVFADALRRLAGGNRSRVRTVQMAHALSLRDATILGRTIRSHGIHLVQTHDARSDVIGLPIARLLGRRSVAFAHGWVNWTRAWSKHRFYAALEARAVRWADRIIVASLALRDDLLRRGVPATKIRHIPYGIDTARFTPAVDATPIRAELGIPPRAPLVGMVGRFHPWKGHRHFVEAAARVSRDGSDAHFLIVGDITSEAERGCREEVVALVGRLGLGERCHFTGTRTDIPRIMRALDVLVVPSLREPFGIVSLEAQASGTPVVAFAVDGLPETLRDGETGCLVPVGDSRRLAETVLELLQDRARAARLAGAGPAWVESRYSVRAMVQKTRSLYEELLS